jgi:hypothetical protein
MAIVTLRYYVRAGKSLPEITPFAVSEYVFENGEPAAARCLCYGFDRARATRIARMMNRAYKAKGKLQEPDPRAKPKKGAARNDQR